ncbi:hypothetical protein ACWKT5_26130 [Streptomyces avermitilis]
MLLLVLVLGLPMAAVCAGLTAYASAMRTVQVRSAQRHQVTARLTSAPDVAPGSATDEKHKAQVSWTGQDGRQQTATVRVPLNKTSGSTVRIWVDREGIVRRGGEGALTSRALTERLATRSADVRG